MKREKSSFLDSITEVVKFVFLLFLLVVMIFLFLYEVKLDSKGYDLVFLSRISESSYYGVDTRRHFEIWKISKNKNGGIYIRRIFPHAD